MKLLLEVGADPHASGLFGLTTLMHPASSGASVNTENHIVFSNEMEE